MTISTASRSACRRRSIRKYWPNPSARLAREQNILRVKGYVAVKGKPMRLLVQAVGERVRSQFDRPWGDTPRTSQLVVIAERHHIDRAAIEATLGV